MKRVLVIDDAATVRLYHRELLERAGFAVEEALNGLEGLEKALSADYDLYLVDINMPKMNGYRFLQQLRAQPERAQAPAIMISTEAEGHDARQAYAAGANAYLVKPVRPERLLTLARILMGERGR